MKIFKRIVYTLLSLLLLAAVGMVGIILYAEYSGRRFLPEAQPDMTVAFLDEESRLVYDENGNLAELPEGIPAVTEETQSEETASADTASQTGFSEDTEASTQPEANESSVEVPVPASADHREATAADTNDNTEQLYVMDKSSNLFHTADCPYAANIAAEYKTEMTTTREKIMNAAYQPCSNCNP